MLIPCSAFWTASQKKVSAMIAGTKAWWGNEASLNRGLGIRSSGKLSHLSMCFNTSTSLLGTSTFPVEWIILYLRKSSFSSSLEFNLQQEWAIFHNSWMDNPNSKFDMSNIGKEFLNHWARLYTFTFKRLVTIWVLRSVSQYYFLSKKNDL